MRSKNAVYNFLASIIEILIVTLVSFIVPHYIIKTYGSGVNGLMSSVTQYLGYIALIESGVGPIGRASLYKPLAEKNIESLSTIAKTLEDFYKKVSFIFLAYVVVLSFFFPILVNEDFKWYYTVTMIVILAISTFVQYYFGITYQTILQADQKKYITSLLQVFSLLIYMAISLILIMIKVKIHFVLLGGALAYIVRPIALYFYVNSHYKLNKKACVKKDILKQRWDGFAQHIAFFVHKNTDIAILTIMSSVKEVSVYSVYMLAVSGCAKVVNIFSSSLEPAFGNMLAKKEKDTFKNRVDLCSLLTNQVTIVLFSTAAIAILPFVKLYTREFTDVNYIRPAFGIIMLIAEAFYCIRLPYQSAIYAAGHFKQTRNGAIVEALINIIISVVLVLFYGLIGVAVGTLVAMSFRTIQFIWYYNKKLINTEAAWKKEVKKIMTSFIEMVLIFGIKQLIPAISSNSYLLWILNTCVVGCGCFFIVVVVSFIFYRKECIELMTLVKKVLGKKKAKGFL